MFEYIKGILVEATPHKAVLEVQGVGYGLLIPLSTYAKLPPIGEATLLYISSIIREDSHRYFGFLTRDERELFETVGDISGIGPKTALALIGHLDHRDLETAITNANVTLLSKIPGIGKKTAERLIVEMRDKISKKLKNMMPTSASMAPYKDNMMNDAMNALMNLGYNAMQAQKAVQKAALHFQESPSLSELIGAALKGV